VPNVQQEHTQRANNRMSVLWTSHRWTQHPGVTNQHEGWMPPKFSPTFPIFLHKHIPLPPHHQCLETKFTRAGALGRWTGDSTDLFVANDCVFPDNALKSKRQQTIKLNVHEKLKPCCTSHVLPKH
jgi:hypothetical protein